MSRGVLEISCTTNGEAATEQFASRFSQLLQPGDTITLSGELGAGKTRFVRGLANGLGIAPNSVHSPTYVLASFYPAGKRGIALAHIDAYRLLAGDDLDSIGMDRLRDGNAILVVEWPERVAEVLEAMPERFEVLLEHVGPEARRISVRAPSGRSLAGMELER